MDIGDIDSRVIEKIEAECQKTLEVDGLKVGSIEKAVITRMVEHKLQALFEGAAKHVGRSGHKMNPADFNESLLRMYSIPDTPDPKKLH